jgi:hypothetical protein
LSSSALPVKNLDNFEHEQQGKYHGMRNQKTATPAQQEPHQLASSASSELGQEECDMMLTPYPLS